MKLSAPTTPVFVISLILGLIGCLGMFQVVNVPNAGYFLAGGWALLTIANVVKGL